MNVVIMGASNNPEKYAYLALQMLQEKGHRVFPVHPALKEIEGIPVFSSIGAVPEAPDTVTLYIGSAVSSKVASEILAASPRRIIFNPGAENPDLEKQARAKGVETLNACTLVLLRTGQF